MDVSYINPFIISTTNVFQTVLSCGIHRRKLWLKDTDAPEFEVSAVIQLSGKARGAVVFSVSPPVAFMIVEWMLETKVEEINADVVDAVGELANMIAGGAKTLLSSYELQIGLPRLLTGAEPCGDFPPDARPIGVLFDTPAGPISLEVGLDTTAVDNNSLEVDHQASVALCASAS